MALYHMIGDALVTADELQKTVTILQPFHREDMPCASFSNVNVLATL